MEVGLEHMMLETGVRAVVPEDLNFVSRLKLDPKVRAFLGGALPNDRLDQALAGVLTPHPMVYRWIATHDSGRVAAGLITLAPHHERDDMELSFEFLPKFWGQGVAANACRTVLDHAREVIEVTTVLAETQSANQRSCRLLARLGFEKETEFERFGAQQYLFACQLAA